MNEIQPSGGGVALPMCTIFMNPHVEFETGLSGGLYGNRETFIMGTAVTRF